MIFIQLLCIYDGVSDKHCNFEIKHKLKVDEQ